MALVRLSTSKNRFTLHRPFPLISRAAAPLQPVVQQLRLYQQDDNKSSTFESQLLASATLDDSSTPIVKRTRVYRSKPSNVSRTKTSATAGGTGQTAIQREILHTLQHRLNTKTRVNSNNYLEVKECYLCNKSKKSNSDNIWKLNVRPDGSYYCFRCSVGGNYEDFKMKINQYAADSFDLEGDCAVVANSNKNTHSASSDSDVGPSTTSKPLFDDCTDYFPDDNNKPASLSGVSSSLSPSSSSSSSSGMGDKYLLPMQRLANAYHLNLFPSSPSSSADTAIDAMHEQRQKVKVYLNEQRGLHDDILQKYQVGYTVQQFLNEQEEWKDQLCVTFPWILLADQVHQSHRFTSPPALQPTSSSSSGSSSKGSGSVNVKAGYGKRGKQVLGPNSTLSTSSSTNSGSHAFIEDPIKISFSHAISDEEKNKAIESSSSLNESDCSHNDSHRQTSNLEEEYPVYIIRTKYRSLETKGLQRILPKGGAWGFFGWHTIHETEIKAAAQAMMKQTPSTSTPITRSVIITEGEYDAMAVAQGLQVLPDHDRFKYIPVISLPNGCNSLPNELVSMLDRFDTIYLWMDYDKSGQEACEKFTRKLGLTRCLIVKPLIDRPNPPKDANDALRQGDPTLIPSMLKAARTLSHQRIEQFSTLRQALKQKLSSGQLIEGSSTPSIPGLTQICKGFRRGEMVVVSGPTGSGKTTLLSQLSLDFAQAGKPVLWGSFEVKNPQLNMKMIHQFAKLSTPLTSLADESISKIMDDFEALPLQFMNYYGATNIDDLFDTMEYAVDKDDIQHVFIDNLQFLMPRVIITKTKSTSLSLSNNNNPFERIELQEQVIDRFRNFATTKQVNVIIVIHPKKEDDFTMELGLGSIGNSAKCCQEADMVMILQKPSLGGSVALDVKKNRYDGFLGRLMMQYNAVNQTLTQASDIISFQTENSNNHHANQKSKFTNALGMKVTIPPKDLWERALKRREEASASLLLQSQQKNVVMETTIVTDDLQEEKKNEMMKSSISSFKEIQKSLSDAKAMPDVSSSSMVSDTSTTSVVVGTTKKKASPRKKKVPSS